MLRATHPRFVRASGALGLEDLGNEACIDFALGSDLATVHQQRGAHSGERLRQRGCRAGVKRQRPGVGHVQH